MRQVVVSAHAPGLFEGSGLFEETIEFVVRDDGTIVSKHEIPVELLDPLADAVTEELGPPFSAHAARDQGDIWSVKADEAEVVEESNVNGTEIVMSSIDGVFEVSEDGVPTDRRSRALQELLAWHGGDASLTAERFK